MNFHQNLKQETCTSFLYKFLERMSLRVQVYSIIRMFYTGSIYTWCVSSPEPYRVVRWPYTLCRISRALTSVFGCTEIDYTVHVDESDSVLLWSCCCFTVVC